MTYPPRMAESPARSSPWALPALLVANMALACGPWLVRLARSEAEVGPVAAGFWRLALALPVLLIAAARLEKAPPERGALLATIALAGLCFAVDLGLWHVGILHTRLANATLLGNVPALAFPLYGFVVARTWPQARQWIALALAGLGAVLLLGRSYELSANNLLGDVLCIVAGFCYTGYMIAADRARVAVGPLWTLGISVIVGAPVLLLFAAGMGETIVPHVWWPLVTLSVGSQLVGQGLILFAVGRVPPLIVGLMLLTQPIVAATIGWIAYGERLTLADAIGALGVAAAVLLVRDRAPRRPKRPLPEEERALSSVP